MRLFIEDYGEVKAMSKQFGKIEKYADREMKKFVNEVSDVGYHSMRGFIPKYTRETMRRIQKDGLQTNLQTGNLQRNVGIKRDGSTESKLPLWLHEGTGVWGAYGRPYFNVNADYMMFRWKGRFFRTRIIRGQKRSNYWNRTIEESTEFATIRARTMFHGIL